MELKKGGGCEYENGWCIGIFYNYVMDMFGEPFCIGDGVLVVGGNL